MRQDRVGLLLFVLYCVEIGLFLVLAPWTVLWAQTLGHLPSDLLVTAALHPIVRAGVSGFGLVHLIWGAHDLALFLRRPSP